MTCKHLFFVPRGEHRASLLQRQVNVVKVNNDTLMRSLSTLRLFCS